MKKKLFGLMLAMSAAVFAHPGHSVDGPAGASRSSSTHGTDKDKYEVCKFNMEWKSNVWKFAFGRKNLAGPLAWTSKGDVKVDAAYKLSKKSVLDAKFEANLNLIPYEYATANIIGMLENRIRRLEAQLADPDGIDAHSPTARKKTEKKLADAKKELAGLKKPGMKWEPQKLVEFKKAHVGYKYTHNENAKVYTKVSIEEKSWDHNHMRQYLTLHVNPSYDFKDYMYNDENIKVKSLKFTPVYEISASLMGTNQEYNQFLDLGITSEIELPLNTKVELDLSKLFSANFNTKFSATTTYITGGAKIGIKNKFELFKNDKQKLTLENKFAWKTKWAWNEKGKDIVDKDRRPFTYKNKFMSDEISNETTLAHTYKIKENLSINSEAKLKYVGLKDRKTDDAVRVHTFTPTAKVGINYDRKLNDHTKFYTGLDLEFSTLKEKVKKGEEEKDRVYFIEPKIKVGLKYTY